MIKLPRSKTILCKYDKSGCSVQMEHDKTIDCDSLWNVCWFFSAPLDSDYSQLMHKQCVDIIFFAEMILLCYWYSPYNIWMLCRSFILPHSYPSTAAHFHFSVCFIGRLNSTIIEFSRIKLFFSIFAMFHSKKVARNNNQFE